MVTACHQASTRGGRLMMKWVEFEIHSEKGLLHVSLDHIRSILTQTMAALLIIEEQIGSSQAIHLHVLQLPKGWVVLQYVHYHSHIPGERGRTWPTRAISHHHLQHHGIFLCWRLIDPFPDIHQCIRQPLHRKCWGAIQWHVFPLFIWGIHLSRVLVPV